MKALLSSTYFGPIQWYQKLNRYDECLIERHESFIPDAEFESKRYYQVYEQKFGFQPNMSILDLLFNEGNEAIFYL